MRFRFPATALVAGLALVPATAHAYLDPGTGSVLVQSLIAALAVASAGIVGYWQRVRAFFSRRQDPPSPVTRTDDDAPGR